ncbi:MAG: Calx-beta domain-containing protein [Clostridia bacterium]|nr:Calx-beta domain-containing protein [Clostridia bacterium]
MSLQTIGEEVFSEYQAVWDAKETIDTIEIENAQIKVTINDGELANNIAEAISPNFNLDSKAPTIVENITFDAGIAGQESSATITIPRPEEISQVSYYITDDSLIESNPQNSGWVVMDGEEVTIPWTFDSDVEVKSLKYKFKDVFGNETVEMIASTHTPVATSSFMLQDTSNISAVPPYYDVYIGWQASEETGFSSYKLEQATSSDNITYNDYVDISSASLSNYTTNYYISRNLNPDLYYKYRLGVVNSEGNVSVRSNASIITKPDGVQNYGEGGGGSVATAPRIENITATQQADKSVIVNFKLTDDSLVKKIYPNYEAYLFYNHGVTVASNYLSGGNLEVSDATLLPESGYIQVNNEVIKYTTKTGNTLSGLSRGTWPDDVTSGRATRTSAVLYEGSPVWVMANQTEPITIENTSILSGQNEEMVWLAQEEESLAGFSYDNFGLRVLIHDNQDALSGPISTQNDYSEDSLINNLDLEAPFISFEVAEMSVIENTDSILSIPLVIERPYMFDSTVNYTVSGTATRGLDYILADGQVTIEAGQIQNSINLNIIDDAIKEEPENIIITLSDPNNTRLGSNSIITITIGDNESFSGLGFDLVASSNTENITLVPVKIILAEVSGIDVTASYTVSGTAIRDEDYVLADGSITILAGEDEAIIDLYITDDALKETDETVVITINEVTGATLNENSVYTYTIVDNDTYPTLSFSQPTSQAREDINVAEILVSLSSAYPEEIHFNYSIVGGSAEGDGLDYRVEETEAIIEPGSTTGLIPIIIYDDDLSEETENILVSIHDPVNAILGSEVTHGLSILDNEILITEINGSQTKSTSVRITWTTDDYTDSLIEYGLVPDGQEGAYAMSKHSTEKVLNHDVYIDELTPETTYFFRTTSTNLAGETTVSRSQFTTTAGPVISQVSTTGETDTTATITWTTDILSNSAVYYSTDPEMLNPQSQNTPDQTTDHSVSLNNLTPNEIYYFFVTSTDEEGNIGEDLDGGNYYSFSTEDDETPPTISNILIPVRTNSQVAITWRTNEQADGLIRYGLDPDELENESELIELPLIDHLIALDNLEEETTYYYVIESADENGNKTISSPQTFETTKKERVVVFAGSGTPGVAQELYDMILAENQAYKARLDSLNDIKPEISDVEISNITAFSADVSFRTSEDTVAFVKYGKEGSLDKMVANNDWSRNHLINLSGLSLGTEYAFVISVMDKSNDTGESEEYTFTTRYLAEDLDELKKIENVEQFQKEIESTIESILPSLVPPFIERPTVTNITESSATISYKTNIKTYPIVSFVEESKYDLTKENPYNRENSNTTEKSNSHNLELTGLMPNTKYHFSARAYSLPGVIGQYEDLTFMTKASKIQAQIANITNSSFDVIWTTDEPTSSIVEYKNTRTGKIAKIVDEKKIVSHSIKVENLESGVSFEVFVSGINPKGNLVEAGSSRVVKTLLDEDAPIVANLKVDSAMVQGRNDKVQTIISWQTNEPSTSTIRYQEGTGKLDSNLSNSAKDLELTQNHVVILSSLKPGTVYRFTIVSTDQAGNSSELPVRTIITPNKTESIVDVIFKNFDETFNFIKNIR